MVLNQAKVERLGNKRYKIRKSNNQRLIFKILKVELQTSVNLRYQALWSPVDGVVFDLQPRGKGYVAQGTETVMKIVPYDTLQANIEIPSSQIGFVQVGMLQI